jgi:hypothetical protein
MNAKWETERRWQTVASGLCKLQKFRLTLGSQNMYGEVTTIVPNALRRHRIAENRKRKRSGTKPRKESTQTNNGASAGAEHYTHKTNGA